MPTIRFQWDLNPNPIPNHLTSDLLAHQTFQHYGPGAQRECYCDTKNPVHKELSTVTYWDRDTKGMVHVFVTYWTLWHIGYVTPRVDPITHYFHSTSSYLLQHDAPICFSTALQCGLFEFQQHLVDTRYLSVSNQYELCCDLPHLFFPVDVLLLVWILYS